MERRGYVVAKNNHALFSQHAREKIEARARATLSEMEKQRGISLPPIRFSIRSQATGSQTPSSVIATAFPQGDHQAVRLILSQSSVPTMVLQKAFVENELFVSIEESGKLSTAHVLPGFSNTSCRVMSPFDRSARLIEDVIIDVTVGSFFRLAGPLDSLVKQEGLPSLFARKVKFARRSGRLPGAVVAAKGARYVAFASLSSADDDDIASRAADTYQTWLEFTESLTPHSIRSSATGSPATIKASSSLSRLPQFGAQLPMKKIDRIVAQLPAGAYTLIILRSASATRKSPAIRGQISSIFGHRARQNSIKVYPRNAFIANSELIEKLSHSNHVRLVEFEVERNRIYKLRTK